MGTISQHALAVEAVSSTIPVDQKIVYLASVGDLSVHHHDAKVLPVPRGLALRYVAKKTHRLATAPEINAYDAAEVAAKNLAESQRALPINAETIAAVARAAQKIDSENAGTKTKARGE